jgi:hypothetical protein
MTCDTCRDKLIDLLYDELDPAQAATVRQHLAGCETCSAEWTRLRRARAALARTYPNQPDALPLDRPVRRGRLPVARVVGSLAAAAAVLLAVGLGWYALEQSTPPAVAGDAPVSLRRTHLAMTVLNQPPQWRGPWPGMALVRDERVIRRLPAGVSEVRFDHVPPGIRPDSVRLTSLDAPGTLTLLEQNYQYDLATASAVLDRHIDRVVSAVGRDGRSVRGTLLSHDARSLVLQPAGEGPVVLDRAELAAIRFSKLPAGLLTRPTLVWTVDNAGPRHQQLQVAYLTEGLRWQADYQIKLRPGGKVIRERTITKTDGTRVALPDVQDTADLVGYATIINQAGSAFADARLKLMAGDVRLIPPPFVSAQGGGIDYDTSGGQRKALWFGLRQKAFFEYHLYTLGRPTTLASNETKQLHLTSAGGVTMRRKYIFNPQVHPTAPQVVSELVNAEDNHLGRPLPKGTVRLYAPDPAGLDQQVGVTSIDHTAADETLEFTWGHAFDIACTFRESTYRRRAGWDHLHENEYTIANHKGHDVTVVVVVQVPRATYQAKCAYPWSTPAVGWVNIPVPVPAGQGVRFTFTYAWGALADGLDATTNDRF